MSGDRSRKRGPVRRTLATVEFGGEHAELQVGSDGRHILRGSAGSEQELTETEAEDLRRFAHNLEARAEAIGLPIAGSEPNGGVRVSELRAALPTDRMAIGLPIEGSEPNAGVRVSELRAALPTDRMSVLVDTTTLFNAQRALRSWGRAPSAVGLLDLSVLTAAAILFDTIVIQPERSAPLEGVEDLAHVLPPSSDTHAQLRRIYDEAWQTFSRSELLAEYRKRWALFLDVPSDKLSVNLDPVRSFESHTMSRHYEWAADLLAPVGGSAELLRRRDELATALGVQTMRTGFNDAVASALGVPYLATSLRLPVSSDLVDRKTQLLWVLRELIARSTAESTHGEPRPFGTRPRVAAPLLLGLVLQRMTKPDDYHEALAEVRDRFGALRRELRETRESAPWDEKPQLYLERFTKHMSALAGKAGAIQVTGPHFSVHHE